MAISPLGDHHLPVLHPEVNGDVVAPYRAVTAHREQVVIDGDTPPLCGRLILGNPILTEGNSRGLGLMPSEEGEDIFGGLGSHISH